LCCLFFFFWTLCCLFFFFWTLCIKNREWTQVPRKCKQFPINLIFLGQCILFLLFEELLYYNRYLTSTICAGFTNNLRRFNHIIHTIYGF
jgi:hypothetical protein